MAPRPITGLVPCGQFAELLGNSFGGRKCDRGVADGSPAELVPDRIDGPVHSPPGGFDFGYSSRFYASARTLMAIEGVPDIPMFRQNTAAFIHEMDGAAISNVDGASGYVRIQVLTNAGALDREKQIAVVGQFTELVAAAAGDSSLSERTWVLLTEATEGGWGLGGHANTNEELVAAARAQIAALSAGKSGDQIV